MEHKVKRCKECFKYYTETGWMKSRANGYCCQACQEKRDSIMKKLDKRIIGNGMSYLELMGEEK